MKRLRFGGESEASLAMDRSVAEVAGQLAGGAGLLLRGPRALWTAGTCRGLGRHLHDIIIKRSDVTIDMNDMNTLYIIVCNGRTTHHNDEHVLRRICIYGVYVASRQGHGELARASELSRRVSAAYATTLH